MTKHKSSALRADQPQPGSGIFGPDWYRWRGATLRVELEGEPPFLARLDEVKPGLRGELGPHTIPLAFLTELDGALRPVGVRELPWPPSGTVRVLRSP